MTPGLAQSREQLPWLYYPESDRVIINAHNFNPIWTPSVNGKNPIAAWVPSRDTAGNGTTTLLDFAGSNDGTLTNMDAATDWVSDTDAGGIRALDFDGTNDFVSTALSMASRAIVTISAWVYRSNSSHNFRLQAYATNSNRFGFTYGSSTLYGVVCNGASNQWIQAASFTATGWQHFVLVFDGTQTGNSNRLKLWVNGAQPLTTFSGTIPSSLSASAATMKLGGDSSGGGYATGRIDDVRIFDQALDATDIADLYASSSGRGVQA
jgi:hypothetical protein